MTSDDPDPRAAALERIDGIERDLAALADQAGSLRGEVAALCASVAAIEPAPAAADDDELAGPRLVALELVLGVALGLPFGRGAMVFGTPIRVPRDAEPEAFEALRLAVEAEMNRVHDRAYTLVGRPDRVGNPA